MNSTTLHAEITAAFQHHYHGNSGRAEFMLGHLLIRFPGNAMVLTALADLNYQTLRMADAIACTEKAVSNDFQGTLDEALYVSKMLRCIGEDESAMALARKYANTADLSPMQSSMLAIHFLNLDLIDESLVQFERVDDQVLGDHGIAMHGIAKLYNGDVFGAKNRFQDCLSISPAHSDAALHIAMLDVRDNRDERISVWESVCQTLHSGADYSQLCFALFHEYDAKDSPSIAYKWLEKANTARLVNQPYNADMETELVNDYIDQLAAIDFSEDTSSGESTVPVFIIGLPRTGTTLLEKSLTSVANLQAVGEHLNFRKAIERQLGRVFTSPFEIADRDFSRLLNFKALGQRYLEKTHWRAKGRPYYTDKEPFNFVYAGLISKAIPEARIIHIRRNPMDACFSAYKQSFAVGGFPASYALDTLAAYYRNYERVMAFWRTALGSRMLEIRYEDLVLRHADTMQEIKAYCRFKESTPASGQQPYKASTLSAAQVQKPIHAGNINAWAKYREYLKPLREDLDAEYTAYMGAIEGVEIL